MTPSALTAALRHAISARIPTLTLGEPGGGKSALHIQAAEALGYRSHILYPAHLDPTDVGGLPIPRDGRIKRMLDDGLMSVIEATEPTLLFLDELGQASPAMQAACAPILLERRVGPHRLPDCVALAAAGNLRQHRAGSGGILTHLISRCTVLRLESHEPDWHQWAVGADVAPEVTGFLGFRPALLHVFDAARAAEHTEPYPCERSWVRLSDHVRTGLPRDVEREIAEGCIGPAAATEWLTYLAIAREVDVRAFLADASRPLPTQPSSQWALASGAAAVADATTLPGVLALGMRMLTSRPRLGAFAALLIRDLLRRWPAVTLTPAWRSADGEALRETLL